MQVGSVFDLGGRTVKAFCGGLAVARPAHHCAAGRRGLRSGRDGVDGSVRFGVDKSTRDRRSCVIAEDESGKQKENERFMHI